MTNQLKSLRSKSTDQLVDLRINQEGAAASMRERKSEEDMGVAVML